MGLKYQLDTLDGLDDSVKSLYTEKEGKFVLGIEGLPQTTCRLPPVSLRLA